MILSFRHRGLERLYEHGERQHISAEHVAKVERVLSRLDVASGPRDVDLPGYRLHSLRGNLEGFFAVTISGNWRLVFRFEDGDARDVDLVDHH